MSTIAVVVVNYNTRNYLHACLESAIAEAPAQIVVVDNSSSDGSAEMVQEQFPDVTLIGNRENRGYGAAANQGISACTTDYVLLLNSDTVVRRGALEMLAKHLEQHLRAGLVGPCLVGADGELQPSCFPFPTVLNTFLWHDTFGWLIQYFPLLRDNYARTFPHDRNQAVPWVTGAALAIRREAFEKLGGFNESYFMYSEEVDLCFRLYQAGWETHFTPTATIAHVGGASTSQRRSEMAVQRFTSHMEFARQHYSTVRFWALVAVVKTIAVMKLIGTYALYLTARDDSRRKPVLENLALWRRLLLDVN